MKWMLMGDVLGCFGMFQRGTFFCGRRLVAGLRSLTAPFSHAEFAWTPPPRRSHDERRKSSHHVIHQSTVYDDVPKYTKYYRVLWVLPCTTYTIHCKLQLLHLQPRRSKTISTSSHYPPNCPNPQLPTSRSCRLDFFVWSRWICFTQVV